MGGGAVERKVQTTAANTGGKFRPILVKGPAAAAAASATTGGTVTTAPRAAATAAPAAAAAPPAPSRIATTMTPPAVVSTPNTPAADTDIEEYYNEDDATAAATLAAAASAAAAARAGRVRGRVPSAFDLALSLPLQNPPAFPFPFPLPLAQRHDTRALRQLSAPVTRSLEQHQSHANELPVSPGGDTVKVEASDGVGVAARGGVAAGREGGQTANAAAQAPGIVKVGSMPGATAAGTAGVVDGGEEVRSSVLMQFREGFPASGLPWDALKWWGAEGGNAGDIGGVGGVKRVGGGDLVCKADRGTGEDGSGASKGVVLASGGDLAVLSFVFGAYTPRQWCCDG
ncbi:unnamed protein product [Closterium sp. NIES-65]|nr:unnamed protein product [Closterium sp. NIES-65]